MTDAGMAGEPAVVKSPPPPQTRASGAEGQARHQNKIRWRGQLVPHRFPDAKFPRHESGSGVKIDLLAINTRKSQQFVVRGSGRPSQSGSVGMGANP